MLCLYICNRLSLKQTADNSTIGFGLWGYSMKTHWCSLSTFPYFIYYPQFTRLIEIIKIINDSKLLIAINVCRCTLHITHTTNHFFIIVVKENAMKFLLNVFTHLINDMHPLVDRTRCLGWKTNAMILNWFDASTSTSKFNYMHYISFLVSNMNTEYWILNITLIWSL